MKTMLNKIFKNVILYILPILLICSCNKNCEKYNNKEYYGKIYTVNDNNIQYGEHSSEKYKILLEYNNDYIDEIITEQDTIYKIYFNDNNVIKFFYINSKKFKKYLKFNPNISDRNIHTNNISTKMHYHLFTMFIICWIIFIFLFWVFIYLNKNKIIT